MNLTNSAASCIRKVSLLTVSHYNQDGGHGMIFKSFSDQYYLVLHYPNKFGKEHPSFMPLKYEDGKFIQ